MAFTVYSGNSLDLLADTLADHLSSPLASPFTPEIILVQSKGMERWVSLQLAARHGVCANCRFPFPNAFIDEIFRRCIPGLSQDSVFADPFCVWKLMDLLPAFLGEPGFEHLKNYLSGPDRELKQLQLCRRIADTFDQYTIFRPELLRAWERRKLLTADRSRELWQSALWRELARGREREHRAALAARLLELMGTARPGDLGLPQRVSLFGISYLPQFHLGLLKALSDHVQINAYVLNPCTKEYWGEIASRRDIRKIARATGSSGITPEDHLEIPNSLLASLGILGRDFFRILLDYSSPDEVQGGSGSAETLLAVIQSDIRDLRESRLPSGDLLRAGDVDTSIQLHVCHSAMREVEALYAALLDLFRRDPELKPQDIIVMTPDIEAYAPFVQAVFSAPEDAVGRGGDSTGIPFTIADRCMRRESRLIDAFLKILELQGERMTAPQVMEILEVPAVRTKFGLGESAIETVVRWLSQVEIRWGIDGASTAAWSPIELHENTWAAGIDRMLLGYAMAGQDLFQGILPYDQVEGGDCDALGGLISFVKALFGQVRALAAPRPLAQWSTDLTGLVDRFFALDGDARQALPLRQALAGLETIQTISSFSAPVGLRTLTWYLSRQLEQGSFGYGFMTRGITFCAMLPMRSIPFKVVCLIGMNDGAIPRQQRPVEFDLIAAAPRAGDRSVRDEDRYLFLEAILSAREKLYISYTGQSSRDDSPIPPSVLVSELTDYINKVYDRADADRYFTTKHRLQPFNPAYFIPKSESGPCLSADELQARKLYSYSRRDLAVAQSSQCPKTEPGLFVPERLPDPAAAAATLQELCSFFTSPVKFLLNRRLGLYLGEERLVLEDVERFRLDNLTRYVIEDRLVKADLSRPREELFAAIKATGKLPHGTPGEVAFRGMIQGVEDFARRLQPHVAGPALDPLDIDLAIDGFGITGRLSPLYPGGMVQYRYAALKAKDYLSAWLRHLLLGLAVGPAHPRETRLIGLDGARLWAETRFRPVTEGAAVLRQLLNVYREGLTRPLHFFPQLSLEYAQSIAAGRDAGRALERARSQWRLLVDPESMLYDPYLHLCFRDENPLDEDFARYAEEICRPVLNCIHQEAHAGI